MNAGRGLLGALERLVEAAQPLHPLLGHPLVGRQRREAGRQRRLREKVDEGCARVRVRTDRLHERDGTPLAGPMVESFDLRLAGGTIASVTGGNWSPVCDTWPTGRRGTTGSAPTSTLGASGDVARHTAQRPPRPRCSGADCEVML